MKKILLLVLTMVFAFTCALSASANPYGGGPKPWSISTIKLPTASRGWPGTYLPKIIRTRSEAMEILQKVTGQPSPAGPAISVNCSGMPIPWKYSTC